MEAELFKALAGAGPWAVLLGWMLYRFDVYKNRLLTEGSVREREDISDIKNEIKKTSN